MLTVLLGVAALTVDVGQMYAARSELQRAADAAALAGASAYTTEEMMMVRMAKGGTDTLALIRGYAQARAQEMSSENNTLGAPTLVDAQDITPGWLNVYSATEPIVANPDPTKYNAVRVVARRQEHSGPNGPVPLFFAPILGKFVTDASASAVAVFDDRVSGFDPAAPGAANLLPFTISEKAYYSELASGSDSYSYDDNSGAVSSSPDGIREIRLYPYPLSGSGYTEGDGNFGTLNIGSTGQGAAYETNQILNGVSPADIQSEIGTSVPTFYDVDGSQVTYDITGSPGLEATLKAPISQIKGQVIGFFLHTNVVLSGSNATYTVTALRFGRVMDIRLTGPPHQRGFFVQPVAYTGSGVHIDPEAPSTGGQVGLLVLAR